MAEMWEALQSLKKSGAINTTKLNEYNLSEMLNFLLKDCGAHTSDPPGSFDVDDNKAHIASLLLQEVTKEGSWYTGDLKDIAEYRDDKGQDFLMMACSLTRYYNNYFNEGEYTDFLKALISQGCSPANKDNNGNNVLGRVCHSISRTSTDAYPVRPSSITDLNCVEKEEFVKYILPLSDALVIVGWKEQGIFELLLSEHLPPQIVDGEVVGPVVIEQTALRMKSTFYGFDLLSYLIENCSVDVLNVVSRTTGRTPLLDLAYLRRWKANTIWSDLIIKILKKENIELNTLDNNKQNLFYILNDLSVPDVVGVRNYDSYTLSSICIYGKTEPQRDPHRYDDELYDALRSLPVGTFDLNVMTEFSHTNHLSALGQAAALGDVIMVNIILDHQNGLCYNDDPFNDLGTGLVDNPKEKHRDVLEEVYTALANARNMAGKSPPSKAEVFDDCCCSTNACSDVFDDQDTMQFITFYSSWFIEIYKMLVGSMLILFVPQLCEAETVNEEDHCCSLQENMDWVEAEPTESFYLAALIFNFITMGVFFLMYIMEFRREQLLVTHLDFDEKRSLDVEKVAIRLKMLPLTVVNELESTCYAYHVFSYCSMVMFVVNVVLSGVVINVYSIGSQTETTFVTNILFMGMKLMDVYNTITSKAYLSAYLKTKVHYNDVDEELYGDDNPYEIEESDADGKEKDEVGKDSHEDGVELIMPTPTLTASNGAPGVKKASTGVMNAMTPTMTKPGKKLNASKDRTQHIP